MDLSTFAFVGQLATTLPLVGLIWLVQVVSYPLFARVGQPDFPAYHEAHSRLITYVVAPLMLGEITCATLWIVQSPHVAPRSAVWAGALLAAAPWAVTMFISVPQHARLARGFDTRAHHVLVATNWMRTALWTARAAMLLWLVAELASTTRARSDDAEPVGAHQGGAGEAEGHPRGQRRVLGVAHGRSRNTADKHGR